MQKALFAEPCQSCHDVAACCNLRILRMQLALQMSLFRKLLPLQMPHILVWKRESMNNGFRGPGPTHPGIVSKRLVANHDP